MSQQILVTKRNGVKEPLDLEKLHKVVFWATEGITGVSASEVEIKSHLQFFNGIKTSEIQETLIKAAADLISEDTPNYQYVAGRLITYHLRKQVYGDYEPWSLLDLVKKNVDAGFYDRDLLGAYTNDEWKYLNDQIDHHRDEGFTYAAMEQWRSKYLVQNRVTSEIYETPQIAYMLIAATLFQTYPRDTRLRWVKDYYDAISNHDISLPTPVMAGVRTPQKQFSSCVLIESDDSLDSINATTSAIVKYVSQKAGIGIGAGRIRALGSPIRNGDAYHTGVIPFFKLFQAATRSCSQGGIRNASATVFYPIWHLQFDDLIVIKNNQGTEETRVRHMDYGVVLSSLFWRRFKNRENITFFDPNEVPDLYEAFYQDIELFEKLYVKYEQRKDLRTKTMSAEEVFKGGILKERTDTGRIYLVFIDNVQKQGPFDTKFHTIYQSNLCLEINLPTKPFKRLDDDNGRIALCTLGSMNWGAFRNPEDMRRACRILLRSLNNILDYQDFLSIQSRLSNDEIRPIGIGITNLAYWHAKRGLRYGSPEALAEVKSWQEHCAYYLTEATVELAQERGKCLHSDQTFYGQGIFPWERRNSGVNELTDFTPELDWEPLRLQMKQYGVRNATLMAVAPVESSSVVINSTNGIEMPMSLISTKESKAGSLVQVVPEYNRLKSKYQLMWDQTDCVDYLKTAAVIQAYVDQSISTNTFYSPKHFPDRKIPTTLIAKNLMLAHKWGLKGFYYSLTEKQGSKQEVETAATMIPSAVDVENYEEDDFCEACKL